MTPSARDKRCIEVAQRLDRGERPKDLAEEYKVTRLTIYRWNAEGQKSLLPALDDRDTWRQEFVATLAERIAVARENGDDRSLVRLMERASKFMGLDHADAVNEAMVRIEAKKVDLLVEALGAALLDAGMDDATRIRVGHLLDQNLAQLESSER